MKLFINFLRITPVFHAVLFEISKITAIYVKLQQFTAYSRFGWLQRISIILTNYREFFVIWT